MAPKPLHVDEAARRVWYDEAPLSSFGRAVVQLRVLRALAAGPMERSALYEGAWGLPYRGAATDNAIFVTVNRLRKRLAPAGLEIVHEGRQYSLHPPVRLVARAPNAPCLAAEGRVAGAELIGRADELASIRETLALGGVVTLVGPGGVGKTSLARAVLERWSGDVVRVWLEDARTPADISSRMSAALGVEDSVEAIATALAARRPLLFLDNLEQVLDAARASILRWLKGCAVVLATSRVALQLRRERVVVVAGLSRAKGAELLRTRALAAGAPLSRLDDSEALDAVVERLGGLPLAIEFAAARAAQLPLSLIRDHFLTPDLGLVSPDRPDRHHSVRAALTWTWDMLTPPEREVLTRCGAFRGGIPLEALGLVFGQPDSLRIVEQLARHNLLRIAEDRVQVLPLVREFASEKLEEHPDRQAIVLAHARWLAHATERPDGWLDGPDPLGSRRWLTRELDNAEIAIRRVAHVDPDLAARVAVAFVPVLHSRSVERELRVLAHIDRTKVSPPLAFELWIAWIAAARNRDYNLYESFDAPLFALAEQLDDPVMWARARLHAGPTQDRSLHDVVEACKHALDAIPPEQELALATCQAHLAVWLRRAGRNEEALDLYEQAIARGTARGPSLEPLWRYNYGYALMICGHYEAAAAQANWAMQLCTDFGDERLAATVGQLEVRVALGRGEFARAEALADEVIAWRLKVGHPVGARRTQMLRGQARHALGRLDEAEADFREVIADPLLGTFHHYAACCMVFVEVERGGDGARWLPLTMKQGRPSPLACALGHHARGELREAIALYAQLVDQGAGLRSIEIRALYWRATGEPRTEPVRGWLARTLPKLPSYTSSSDEL